MWNYLANVITVRTKKWNGAPPRCRLESKHWCKAGWITTTMYNSQTHTHYMDQGFWKQRFSPLCGKIQQHRISKHFSYDARVWMKVWQRSITLWVQDSVDYSTLVHIYPNSRNEKWERTFTNMKNKGDYWFYMQKGKCNNDHHFHLVGHRVDGIPLSSRNYEENTSVNHSSALTFSVKVTVICFESIPNTSPRTSSSTSSLHVY